MLFLRSLFGQKPTPTPADPGAIKAAFDEIGSFCGDVMHHVGEATFATDAMERQVLSVYAFGGINVLCQQLGFSPPQAHALALALLHKTFGYSAEESATKAQALIEATGDRKSSLNAIIHRGIDGFLAWQADHATFDASDFKSVIATLQSRPTA